MKVFRNTNEIVKRDRMGRRLSMTGLAILFVGLIASFVPTWYPPGTVAASSLGKFMQTYWGYASFAALPLGFLAASFGSYYITRYARRRWPGKNVIARPDELLERSLKGFDDKYALFVFSLPVGYALLTPAALITIALRSDKGKVTVQGDKWREGWGIGRILTLFAREGVGHPPTELADQERKMRAYLAQAGEVNGVKVADLPIEGAVVFLNAETQLDLTNAGVPVLRADQLKDHVRARARELKPSGPLVRAATEYLQTHNAATSTEPTPEPATAKA